MHNTNFLRASRRAYFAAVAVSGLALLAGCSGSSGNSNSGPPPIATGSLVGVWRQTQVATSQASVTCPGKINVAGVGELSCTGETQIEFRADNTFSNTNGEGSSLATSGTWRVENNTLILQTPSGIGTPVTQSFRLTLSGNDLSAAVIPPQGSGFTQYTIAYLKIR